MEQKSLQPSDAVGRDDDSLQVDETGTLYPPLWKTMLIISGLFMGVFLVALDQTIIGTAIPKITDEFKTIQDVGWYGSAYFLTSTALQPSYGRIYKSFDAKWGFLAAIFLFELGSLICAAAPTSAVLVGGRAVAGLGVAGIFSGCTVIMSFIVPLDKRPLAFGLFGAVWGIAFVVGPLLGGAFTDHVTWRWCFYINLPIGAISAVVVLLVLNPPPRPKSETDKPVLVRIRELDLVGALLLTAAVTCLLLVLQWGGKQYPWNDGRIIGLLVGFGILTIVFTGTQIWLGEKATLPPRIISQRTVASACAFVVLFGGSAYLFMYYLPIFFQSIRGSSAIQSGIQLLPMLLGLVVSSFAVGALVTMLGYYTPFLIGSTAIFTVGAGLITTYSAEISNAKWIGYQILAGAGLGAGFQVPQAAVQTVLAQEDIPVGSSALIFFQNLGGSIFISVGQSVFQNSLSTALKQLAPTVNQAVVFSAGATGLEKALEDVGQGSAYQAVLDAYTRGLQDTFRVSLGLGLGALLATLFVEWKNVKQGNGSGNKGNDSHPMLAV
ncbi:hypothetical protein N8I77_012054 [Diaporthe amygdali]|uniref:Major facilitator superfamily (MFS) profile domain-containing protein n=1 Tax=Phomopsis amygdali TaxID=1214568 RepID=A0AAD9S5D9_PHOAM|nr:hypothetical protein N8I77_012054 [Diaporthe amygdali]